MISAGIVATIAAPPGAPSTVDMPVTQFLSNVITLSATKFISSNDIPAFNPIIITSSISICPSPFTSMAATTASFDLFLLL
jgi:hypothetical protein